jgi:putative membrane protein
MSKDLLTEKEQTFKTYEDNNHFMILRDWLALDRTILANERTVLAWTRTGLSSFIGGITLIKYINDTFYQITGYLGVVIGIIVFYSGIFRYIRLRKKLNKLYSDETKKET